MASSWLANCPAAWSSQRWTLVLVCRYLTTTLSHRYDFFTQASTMFTLVPGGITGRICLKSPHKSVHIFPIRWSLPVKSLRVQSRTSNACLLAIGASYTTCIMALASWMTLHSATPLFILQTRIYIAFKSSGILDVLCKVRPPVKSAAAIPLDAVANAISHLQTQNEVDQEKSYLFHLFHQPPLFPSTMEQKHPYTLH